MVQDQQQGAPGKPFFLYFALGAMHAPHHVAPEWVDPYRGRVRQGVGRLARRGVRPPASHRASCPRAPCSPSGPQWVQAWDDLLGRRTAHARPPAGGLRRLPDPHRRPDRPASSPSLESLGAAGQHAGHGLLRQRGQRRGRHASAASTSTASPRTSASRWPTTSPHYDDWGGFSTYNHYSWAWAWAGNTPHKLWKRYTWLGGTRTPLIVHWPGRIAEPGDGARPVRPRHRPHADDPGRGRPRGPRRGRRRAPSSRSTASASCSALEDPAAPPSSTTRSTSR